MYKHLKWLDESEHDLASARFLMSLGHYDDACFFAKRALALLMSSLLEKKLERTILQKEVSELDKIFSNNEKIGQNIKLISDHLFKFHKKMDHDNFSQVLNMVNATEEVLKWTIKNKIIEKK